MTEVEHSRTGSETGRAERVTTFELLFDLVFVFAIGEVVRLVNIDHGWSGLAHAAVVLPLAWLCWAEYAWLGNLGPADRGTLRATMVIGMSGMFFLAVSISRAFTVRSSALALVIALALVEAAVPVTLLLWPTSARRVSVTGLALLLAALCLLGLGTAGVGTARLLWWSGAAAVLLVRVGLVRNRRWDVLEPSHFTERFGLVVLIALGENLVETGTTAASATLTARLATALACVLVLTIVLWWLYFDAFAAVTERVLELADRDTRARLARDGYAYIHLLMVGGIVAAAAGMASLIGKFDAVTDTEGRWLLDGGVAVYLAAHVTFRFRTFRSVHPPRLVVTVVLIVGAGFLGALPPVAQLAWPSALLVVLLAYELIAYRAWREDVRSSRTPTPAEPMTRHHRRRRTRTPEQGGIS